MADQAEHVFVIVHVFWFDEYRSINYERTDIVCENRFLCQLDSRDRHCPTLISGVQSTDFSRVFVRGEKTQLKLVLYTPSNRDPTPRDRRFIDSRERVFPRALLDSGVCRRII